MKKQNTNNATKMYEIELKKQSNLYNPLYVEYKNNAFFLNSIKFYDKNGVVYSSPYGWFGNSSFEVFLKTSNPLVRKLKIDYSTNHPFIIFDKDVFGDKRYALYLPIEDFDLSVTYIKSYNMIVKTISFFDAHQNKCSFDTIVKHLDINIKKIQEKYQDILSDIKELSNMEKIYFYDKVIQLQNLFDEYQKELQKIEDYTVEDYLKENAKQK